MAECLDCGFELPDEAHCYVGTIPEYLGRVGRHMGRCWGGRFPTTADLPAPPLTDDEVEDARDRGAARYVQLALNVEKAA